MTTKNTIARTAALFAEAIEIDAQIAARAARPADEKAAIRAAYIMGRRNRLAAQAEALAAIDTHVAPVDFIALLAS